MRRLNQRFLYQLLLIISASTLTLGQTVSINGKVTNSGGMPLQGVTVGLLQGLLKATTAADGSYSLSGVVGVTTNAIHNIGTVTNITSKH